MDSDNNLSAFKKVLKKSNELARAALLKEALNSKFPVGSHNKIRLKKALSIFGERNLVESTLLTPSIHEIHSNKLAKRFIARWNSINKKNNDAMVAKSKFKFLTLLDCIEVPDEAICLKTIEKFKENLTQIVSDSTGVWLLGSVEVEVVSLEMMRHNRKLTTTPTESEQRKLDVCEKLLTKLKSRDQHLSSYLLVHFHGLVSANSQIRFEQFRSALQNVKRWKVAPRQIELKNLSDSFGGKRKSMEANLKDIARYITKGGNDWVAGKSYLRYKISFDNDYLESEEGWSQKSWRSNELLKQERIEEGIEDVLSMSKGEIFLLARIIDKMMIGGKGRTGYLVFSKSKSKKAAIDKNNSPCVLPI